ncbi:FAD-binding protein [Pseudoclavibacter chungangensis]|uniref:FAD-binding protein n=1 Tax=Pseudoclavibacter chungangensis TaxID=587635 RepID=A0A7J5BP80_9MICO|nr:FAD-linked oxidase C-terminal domain-containing protein [Pseudoclavibacter chungangensis]KAB1653827.1 FAD-binding protein [Pseudoclavibacter chungangensis]NYJ68163.1 glycolate oxidase [Pseudoclavibacter chungangensis]
MSLRTTDPAPAVGVADPRDTTRDALDSLLAHLATTTPGLELSAPSPATAAYGHDRSSIGRNAVDGATGPAVAFPASAVEVQAIVRAAAAHGVAVVARGAGSGLSGGAVATAEQLVVSTDRLNRIVEVSPLDELAVVEPGVVNADLNVALEPAGLFYAPDPASWDISTIGGNIATNAGGLRCAKYGVTRESVLALDVVLADGSLVTLGRHSLKGVAGYDLRSLFVGSQGTLGIVVRATVRLRPIPVARRTLTAFFDDTATGAAALAAITRSPVRPSVVEFFDTGSLENIDRHSGTELRSRGGSLVLVELDGYGIDEQIADLDRALTDAGGRVRVESDADAARLWELRRSGRGFDGARWFTGGDIAVPKSRIPEVYAFLDELATRHGIEASAVSHAGDGNLHPVLSLEIPEGADPAVPDPALAAANDELVRFAIGLGGTITGEHGLGSLKRHLAPLEFSERAIDAQRAIKHALDPDGVLNPGSAL